MMIYDSKSESNKFINCREKAPSGAHKDMYVNGTASSRTGGMAVAVPGEIACLATAHDQYGRLPWAELIDIIIDRVRTSYRFSF